MKKIPCKTLRRSRVLSAKPSGDSGCSACNDMLAFSHSERCDYPKTKADMARVTAATADLFQPIEPEQPEN